MSKQPSPFSPHQLDAARVLSDELVTITRRDGWDAALDWLWEDRAAEGALAKDADGRLDVQLIGTAAHVLAILKLKGPEFAFDVLDEEGHYEAPGQVKESTIVRRSKA